MLFAILLALPQMLANDYYLRIANMTGIAIIWAISLNIVFGYTGQISVGHAAFYAIGAYVSSLLMVRLGVSFWLATPLGILASAIVGLVLGLPTLRLRHYYLAMATLGFGVVIQVLLKQLDWLTEGVVGVIGIPRPSLFGLELGDEVSYYYLVLLSTLVTLILTGNLVSTGIGRALIAIRENEAAAASLGINTTKYKLIAFMLSTAFAGFAGSLYASLTKYISPDSFTIEHSIMILMVVILGGLGSNVGSVIGGVLFVLLPEAVRFMGDYQLVLYSVVLIIFTVFAPRGITGLISDLATRISRSRAASRAPSLAPAKEGQAVIDGTSVATDGTSAAGGNG